MATIGSLAVNIVANTDRFSGGMKKARAEVGLFRSAVGGLSKVMLGFGATLGVRSLFSKIRQSIDDLDELADTAERLGTTIDSLARLSHAGFLYDLSSGALARGLTFMEKNLGNNSAALIRFGLDVKRLKELDAVEMFIQIAEAINKMPTAAERTAAAMAVFGRSGADFLELIGKGRAGIEEAMGNAWFTMSDEDAEDVEALKGALKEVGSLWQAWWKQVGLSSAHGFRHVKEIVADFERISRDMQQLNDDLAVSYGLADEKDTRSFRNRRGAEIAEAERFLKGRKTREISSWPADLQAEYRALDERAPTMRTGSGGLGLSAFGSSMAPELARMVLESLNRNWRFKATELSLGAQSRIAAQIGGMDIAGNAPRSIARRDTSEVRGFQAIEAGTAAAFSQERRSQQQNQFLNIEREQLSEQKQMKEALMRIDTNLRTFERTDPANLA